MSGKRIDVVVPCIEMPRRSFGPKAGDLEAVVTGQTHHLVLKKPGIRLDAPAKPPDGPNGLCFKAASLDPL